MFRCQIKNTVARSYKGRRKIKNTVARSYKDRRKRHAVEVGSDEGTLFVYYVVVMVPKLLK